MFYNKEILAANLKELMYRDKRTQADIMRITESSQSAVSDWLNARKFPRIDKIEILANYFGVNKSDLIEEKTEDSKSERYVAMIKKRPELGELLDIARSLNKDDLETVTNVARRFKDTE